MIKCFIFENFKSFEKTELNLEALTTLIGTNSSGKYYKCEFIELRILSDGNLSGLELYSAYDGDSKSYIFPVLDVFRGEVIIVHLRKKDETAVNELGSDLALSKSKYSSDKARDLWAENENARLGDEMEQWTLLLMLTIQIKSKANLRL